MELTEKNGHASIEEILASVRRIIAEEPGHTAPVIDLSKPMQYPRGDGLLDDPSDFDLPSMFKTPSAAPATDKPGPLFGRLSDAIRAASSNGQMNGQGSNGHSGDRSEHGLSSLNLHRTEPVDTAHAPHFLLSTFHEATSPRMDELAASATNDLKTSIPAHVPAPPAEADMRHAHSAPNEPVPVPFDPAPQVPRKMAAFKDTRYRAMGLPPAVASPMQAVGSPFEVDATAALVEAAATRPAAETFGMSASEAAAQPILMSEEQTAAEDFLAVEAPASLAAAIVASYPSLGPDLAPSLEVIPAAPAPVAVMPAQLIPPPVPQPSIVHGAAEPTAQPEPTPIEDSTADLLRPMLRQWLAENMPRMVEKALHIEMAESGKSPKK